MWEAPTECQMQVDASVETLTLNRQQAAVGIKGGTLRGKKGEQIREAFGITLFGEGPGVAGLARCRCKCFFSQHTICQSLGSKSGNKVCRLFL